MTTGERPFSPCSAPRSNPTSSVRRTPPVPLPQKQSWRTHHNPLRNGRIASRRPDVRRSFYSPNRNVFMLAQNWTLAVLCCVFFLSQHIANASHVYATSDDLLPRDLLFDRSEPPPLPQLMHLAARQFDDPSTSTRISKPTTTRSGFSTSTSTPSSTGLATAIETGTFTLPRPFDSSIGNNFTSTTCPTFFNTFLSDSRFAACLPLSLLLQTSNGFFTASRSLLRLTQILDASCNVEFDSCSNLMASLATQIQQDTTCGRDLSMENPLVLQAYRGFQAYQPLYRAGCLADTSSADQSSSSNSEYCYVNAATDSTNPESSYIYFLPLGVALPGGSRPACTPCLQNTMSIFESYMGSNADLSRNYVAAAQLVQMNCGPTFVAATVQQTGSAVHTNVEWVTMMLLATTVGLFLLG